MNIIDISSHRVITDYLHENSLVFDCGACIGDFADKMYNMFKCHINCYEPDVRNFRKALHRFRDNPNIFVFYRAIDKEKGRRELFYGEFITATSFYSTHRGLNGESELVFTTTIKDEIDEFGNVELLKLDLEGAEIEVIPLIPIEALNKISQITVEFHPQSKIEGYTQEKINICREYLKQVFNEIEYIDKGNDGHHGLYLRKDL